MRASLTLAAALLAGCGQPGDAARLATPGDAGQAALPLVLSSTDAILGGNMTLTISGADPNETVFVVRGVQGLGNGMCLPQIGGQCFGLRGTAALHTQFRADANGNRDKRESVPNIPSINGASVCFQAVVIRGTNGNQSALSNPVCVDIGYDGDSDGILDQFDACPGFDDFFDWDNDGVPDDCDDPADQPPVFETADPIVPWTVGNFQGRQYRQAIPPNANGLVWLFHGTNGSSTLADSPEPIVVLNALYEAGYGFVAFTADGNIWEDDDAPNSNGDYQRILDYRAQLVTQGAIASTTPSYGLGYSNGGSMASYIGHASPTSFRYRGSIYMNHGGRSGRFGATANLPTLWINSVNDDTVAPSDVENQYDDHVASGRNGILLTNTVQRLAPTRWARSPNVNQSRSRENFKIAVNGGYFNNRGVAQFGFNDVLGTIDDIVDLPDFTPDAPGRAVLNVVLATHQFNGQHTDAIVTFVENLP
jgi:hypothetical protein